MKFESKLFWLILATVAMLALAGCSDDDDPTDPVDETPELAFAGSATCNECHGEIHQKWAASGHPYKVIKIDGDAPDEFPAHSYFPNDPINPPAGFTWADVSYTVGGYGWKMRWVDQNGYMMTNNEDTQYNFETQEYVQYTTAPMGTKQYNCGKCHTTGWVASDDDDASNNQDGLEGMTGTFFAGGVHCEECHGQGSQHAFAPADYDMVVDSGSGLCGRCHTRDEDNHIAASGGFIKHHEQYDEWLHSPHNAMGGPGCNDCHDPHSSVIFDDVAVGTGTSTSCTDCHTVEVKHNGAPGCVDCHMPEADKSATAAYAYKGDIRSHILTINTAAVGKMEGMFEEGGAFVIEDADGLGNVTLDFACYGCHKDSEGVGGANSIRSLQELSDYVLGVGEYAGTGGIHSPTTKVAGR